MVSSFARLFTNFPRASQFYDQYIYEEGLEQVSAAEFVEEVNEDNVVSPW
jgi:hypothetical protein